ncbi:PQQ-binding-like beta-propeller repeat protein [Actinoplanes sp. NPDC051633]|uniref:outer membrane protein assembly factor BamB family protein n=1 Tax=Actinoplanes sp. NPDC051633 TaxID=3155670 RepID=UPI003413ADDE
MAGVPMIDLDATAPGADADRPRRPPVPRMALLLALIVLILATLGAAARPAPGLTEVLVAGGTPAAAFELGANALYTATYGLNNPNSESAVRRFDLTTGREVWATALAQGVQNLMVSDAAGVLMARNDVGISFLDPATGKLLWDIDSVNTSAVTIGRGGVLFTTDEVTRTVVRLADARTGTTVWSRPVDARIFFGPDVLWEQNPQRLVAVGMDGSVQVLDFETGRQISRGDLGGPLRPAFDPAVDGALVGTVGDDRLVVRTTAGGRTTMTAYALAPFAELWERTVPPTGSAADCGRVWCVSAGGQDTPFLGAVDPDTGALRWTAPDLMFAARFGDRTIVGGGAGETPELTLRSQETGRVLRRFGRSVRVGDLLLHADRSVPGQTWVQTVDPDGEIRTAGSVPVVAPFGCEQEGAYLACPTEDGPTKVWRVPEA